ncbi:MAG TPA: phenylalanine--tRNA ligase subunit alpha [Candidatus Methanomethylia archaeon]|nr:phenylalanine--tRNA ligase subunit alpha [Candidatus Methanomethylicia archaeon]
MLVLREAERNVLEALERLGGEATLEELAASLSLPSSSVHPLSRLLEEKQLVEVLEESEEEVTLTEEGRRYAEKGLPETRLVKLLKEEGALPVEDLAKLSGNVLSREEIPVAVSWAKRRGWISFARDKDGRAVCSLVTEGRAPEEELLRELLKKRLKGRELEERREQLEVLLRRKLVEKTRRRLFRVKMTEQGRKALSQALVAVTRLTSDLIRTGRWREVVLQEYDVSSQPPKLYPGKKHPYVEFLSELKDILMAMGFVEVEGPYVEFEFWNFDVLFQAQNHPAREVHDSFQVVDLSREIDAPSSLIERVKEVHETGGDTGSLGWRYEWRLENASRRVLRSQTTAVSVRYLAEHKTPPIKVFTLGKVFRPDVIDARHSLEFMQLDGIVGDHGIALKHLLGVLKEIALRLGFEDIRFKPSYFPFTEPSVEGFVKHPKLGWIECLGAGLFRPEVLKPLDIDFPVIAWGIGVDRLAMIRLGINDIRELHTLDLQKLREWEVL